jgi:hypothetical protein
MSIHSAQAHTKTAMGWALLKKYTRRCPSQTDANQNALFSFLVSSFHSSMTAWRINSYVQVSANFDTVKMVFE